MYISILCDGKKVLGKVTVGGVVDWPDLVPLRSRGEVVQPPGTPVSQLPQLCKLRFLVAAVPGHEGPVAPASDAQQRSESSI